MQCLYLDLYAMSVFRCLSIIKFIINIIRILMFIQISTENLVARFYNSLGSIWITIICTLGVLEVNVG